MADEVVRSRFEAETSGYDRAVQSAAKSTDKLADSADKAGKSTQDMGAKGQQSAAKLEAAQKKATAAQDRSADAAGRLRVAQENLNKARTNGDTARVVSAEESVAKAQRDVERTAQEAASAQDALQAGLSQSGNEAQQSTSKFERLSAAVKDQRSNMEQVGGALLGVGTALTGVTVGVGKAAMDWETAWAGVNKTVDGSAEEMAALEGELRTLATTLPATHTEIAAVAEAAGQLGIAREDVAEFTRTMIDLGETTNLTAEEAATSLAQFMNIMGTSADDIDNLGSSLVALGNDGASTEKDILDMAMRVAAVGAQMGMTEADVMALSSAMASLGIESEAGGTAISMVMKKIDSSVREGGDSLTGWAEAAGVSAEEFATAWKTDPAEAMVILTSGLGEVAASGGDVNGMLADLGVTGIREADTMLRLAQSGDLLAESFATGSESFASASALADEASKRYETAESRIAVSWNKIKDSAIDAGGAILPVVASIAEGIGTVAEWFGALPGPVQGALGVLGGIAGVTALAAGGFLTLAPRLFETIDGFKELATSSPRVASGLGKVGKSAGIAAGAAVGITALVTGLTALYNSSRDAAPGVEEVANATLKLNEAGDSADLDSKFDFSGITTHVNGFGDALKRIDLSNPIKHVQSFGDTVFQQDNVMSQVRDTITSLDQALATMDAESAAQQMNALRIEAESVGRMDLSSWSDLQRVFPEYAKGVEAAANATGQATSEADLFQAAMGNLPPHMRDTTEAAEDLTPATETAALSLDSMGGSAADAEGDLSSLIDSMRILGMLNQDVRGASRDWESSLDDLTASIKENGTSLDESTTKGRANWDALEGVADGAWSLAEANAAAGESQGVLEDNLRGGYDALQNNLEAMGLNATQADALAREIMGIPPTVDIDTWMSDRAMTLAQATGAAIEAIPGYKPVTVAVSEEGTAGSVQASINEINGKTEYVFVEDDGTTTVVQQKIQNINGVERTVYVDDDGTIYGTQEDIYAVTGKQVTITAVADTDGAQAAINSIQGKTVRVDVVRKVYGQAAVAEGGIAGLGYFPKHAGGRLPGASPRLPAHAMGRLPYTGRGTDRILGVNAEGWPVARVDDGEGIIKESSTRKHLQLLSMVNDDDPKVTAVGRMLGLPGYAEGNVPSREWSGSSVSMGIDYAQLGRAVAAAMPPWQFPDHIPAVISGQQFNGAVDNRLTHHVSDANRAGRRNTGVR